MATIEFDKQGAFSNADDLVMVLNSSANNSVPVAQKVGYKFVGWYCDHQTGGHVDAKHTTVYLSDGTSYIADQATVTVYEDGTSWIAEDIDGHDEPIVEHTTKVYDSNGKAVGSDFFWSADYPNGVWKYRNDIELYPRLAPVDFVNEYFSGDDKCHLYQEIDGELVRVEVAYGR